MRILFWFLLLAAAAVGIALAARLMNGYALFVAPPYRIELSLNFLLLLVVLAFIGLHVGIRLVQRAARMPAEVRALRRRQQLERARMRQDAAVIALLEGRYGRARKLAEEALAVPQSSGLAALVAARGAIETRDFAAAEALLARADAQVASLAVPRLMLQAEMRLEAGQAIEALSILQALRKEAGLHTAAQRLELRALQASGRYAEIPPLVDQLVKRKVYSAPEAQLLRESAHAAELAARRHDPAALRAYWSRLTDNDQRLPRVARAAAASFIELGNDREAADILARSLERTWSPDLVLAFAECRPEDSTRQLEQAERWLAEHNQDPKLLFALGVLCERLQLWGKAQTYLEASLALDDSYATRVALGELFVRLGKPQEANAHLAAALNLALAELNGERARSAQDLAHA
ncbi:MAG TPA: heme biosynthesis HemY N-terminal domain-containing protein [Casimicrobiaceae bacterium]|nr:heme biosynthesis HemY N-terminal domain-containing protein [Casimicrobiaceae bacterium]